MGVAAALWAGACTRPEKPVDVVVSLGEEAVGVSRLVLSVDYAAAGAHPVMSGGEPACTTLLPFIAMKFSDDGDGTLTVEAFSSTSFSAPLDLAACRMIPESSGQSGSDIAGALRISVKEALDSAGNPLSARKLASVSSAPDRRDVDSRAGDSRVARERVRDDYTPQPATPSSPSATRDRDRPITRPSPSRDRVRDGRVEDGAGPEAEVAPRPQEPPGATQPAAPLVGGGAAGGGGSPGGSGGDGGGSGTDGGGSPGTPLPDGGTAAIPYEITIMVVGQYGDLGALQFDVEYLGPSGNFVGKADGVDCTSLIGAGLAAFTNKGNGKVTGAMVNVNGFSTPGLIAKCTFKSRDVVTTDDFLVTATDASDVETNALEEFPQMAVVEAVPLS